jgi:rhodanese-related sulfurtransferase
MEKFVEFVKNHWTLWLALVLILVLLIIEETRGKWFGIKSITSQDLVLLMNREKAVIIDLRDKNAFAGGHIVGAIPLEIKDLQSEILEKYKDKTIVLVAEGHPMKLNALPVKGYQIFILSGGMEGWRAAGYPVAKG